MQVYSPDSRRDLSASWTFKYKFSLSPWLPGQWEWREIPFILRLNTGSCASLTTSCFLPLLTSHPDFNTGCEISSFINSKSLAFCESRNWAGVRTNKFFSWPLSKTWLSTSMPSYSYIPRVIVAFLKTILISKLFPSCKTDY